MTASVTQRRSSLFAFATAPLLLLVFPACHWATVVQSARPTFCVNTGSFEFGLFKRVAAWSTMTGDMKFQVIKTSRFFPLVPFDFTSPKRWRNHHLWGCHLWGLRIRSWTIAFVCSSSQVRNMLSSLGMLTTKKEEFAFVKTRLSTHFVHPTNSIYECQQLHHRMHQPGETVDAFFTALRSLAVENRLSCNRSVTGLLNEKLPD